MCYYIGMTKEEFIKRHPEVSKITFNEGTITFSFHEWYNDLFGYDDERWAEIENHDSFEEDASKLETQEQGL